jgi:hypothetical protein
LPHRTHPWASGWERRMSPLPQSNSRWTERQLLPGNPPKAISIQQLELNLPEGQVCLCRLALLPQKVTQSTEELLPMADQTKWLSCQVGPRPLPSIAPFLARRRHLTTGHCIRLSRSCSRSFERHPGQTQTKPCLNTPRWDFIFF